MNPGSKHRMQMCCGKPLQCCWWIARSLRALRSGDPGSSSDALATPRGTVRSGARCKS
jgi:hypothetical protein